MIEFSTKVGKRKYEWQPIAIETGTFSDLEAEGMEQRAWSRGHGAM